MNADLTTILGPVDWQVLHRSGFINCPGAELHTTATGARDTRLYLDRVPTIFCLHKGCRMKVREANILLRRALLEQGDWTPPPPTPQQEARRERQMEYERQERRLAVAKDAVLTGYAWPLNSLRAASPVPIRPYGWPQLLDLFDEKDTIWVGEPHHSGSSMHLRNFRRVTAWRQLAIPPAPFICANPFTAGGVSRTVERIETPRHMVIECDELHPDPVLNREMSGAVFKYLLTVRPNLRLRAVIDSGNKSLHGWFTYDAEAHEWAIAVLPALGVDPATLRLAQPVRAPGYRRDTGRIQELLYLDTTIPK